MILIVVQVEAVKIITQVQRGQRIRKNQKKSETGKDRINQINSRHAEARICRLAKHPAKRIS